MLYQYISWHLGMGRRMCVVEVERLFARLRELNGGPLPLYLRRWEQRVIFAGESAINLPEMQAVAENVQAGDAYPTMKWLDDEYLKLVTHVRRENPDLLADPPPTPPVPLQATIVPVTLDLTKAYDSKIEGSVSNTEGREECSDQNRPTSLVGSTSTVLPNSALTTPPTPTSNKSP